MSTTAYFMVGVMLAAVAGAAIRRSREVTLKALALVTTSASIAVDEVLAGRGVPLTDVRRDIVNFTIVVAAIWVLYLIRGDLGSAVAQYNEKRGSDDPGK